MEASRVARNGSQPRSSPKLTNMPPQRDFIKCFLPFLLMCHDAGVPAILFLEAMKSSIPVPLHKTALGKLVTSHFLMVGEGDGLLRPSQRTLSRGLKAFDRVLTRNQKA